MLANLKSKTELSVPFFVILLSIFILSVPFEGIGKTIRIPKDHASLEEAVKAASAGDTLLIASGTFDGTLDVHVPLVVIGNGIDSTILTNSICHAPVKIHQTSGCRIKNLSVITPGMNEMSSVIIDSSKYVYLSEIKIKGGVWTSYGSGRPGLCISHSSNVSIIKANVSGGNGRGDNYTSGLPGGNGVTVQHSIGIHVDSSELAGGEGGSGGYSNGTVHENGKKGYAIALDDSSSASLTVSKLDAEYYKDSSSVISLTNISGLKTAVMNDKNLPEKFSLSQNYPNPFNMTTTIKYSLPKSSHISITVYNMLGERIAEILNCNQNAGDYTVPFDATGLASGIYFYTMKAGSYGQTKKLILLK
jgi:hypothetical protein